MTCWFSRIRRHSLNYCMLDYMNSLDEFLFTWKNSSLLFNCMDWIVIICSRIKAKNPVTWFNMESGITSFRDLQNLSYGICICHAYCDELDVLMIPSAAGKNHAEKKIVLFFYFFISADKQFMLLRSHIKFTCSRLYMYYCNLFSSSRYLTNHYWETS